MSRVRVRLSGKRIDWRFTAWVLWTKLRRELLISLRPRYVLRQIMLREGSCKDCLLSVKGIFSCCKKVKEKTPFECINIAENGSCKAYGTTSFPVSCFACPIDSKELQHRDCNFHWKERLPQKLDNHSQNHDKHKEKGKAANTSDKAENSKPPSPQKVLVGNV